MPKTPVASKPNFGDYLRQIGGTYDRERCDKFAAKFKDDPFWALEHSDDVFMSAARIQVANKVASSLNDAHSKGEQDSDRLKFLLEHLTRNAKSGAKWPRRSTSVTSNLAHQIEQAANMEMIELIEAYLLEDSNA